MCCLCLGWYYMQIGIVINNVIGIDCGSLSVWGSGGTVLGAIAPRF